MKRFSLVFLFVMTMIPLCAQGIQSANKRGLPAFDILQADGSRYKVTDLDKDLPVLLVYFDPDCDHCVLFIQEMQRQIGAFNNIQIVLVTYVPLQNMKSFVSNLQLGDYKSIKVGTEESTFIVRYHYNVMHFPYVALHDKTGNLFATYESTVPEPAELAAMFK